MQTVFDEFISRLNTAEERINKLKARSKLNCKEKKIKIKQQQQKQP